MRVHSVRQSLFIYAIVVCLAVCFAISTVSIFQTLSSSRTEQKKAAERELQTLVHDHTFEQVQMRIASWASAAYSEIAIVSENSKGHSLSFSQTREWFLRTERPWNLIVMRLRNSPETYLVARLPNQSFILATQGHIRFILIVSLVAAIIGGLLLGFLNSRLVLPPLAALQDLASQAQLETMTLEGDKAPNEVAEIAQSFRRTVRKLSEEREQLEAKHKELQAVQAGMSRASKLASLGRVAAGVAHEIGNPLAAIKGYLSLVKRGLDQKEQEEVITRCVSELDRIHDTIRQLLTFARRNDASAELVVFNLVSKVQEVLRLVQNHPALRDIRLEFEAQTEIFVLGHADSLKQVVMNLVLNAGQALDNVKSGEITVSISSEEKHIHLQVTDNGPGIEPEILEQIFDPFFTTKDPGEGTGLGLAVSRALMEDMGGNLSCTSELEQGAQFTVRLQKQ